MNNAAGMGQRILNQPGRERILNQPGRDLIGLKAAPVFCLKLSNLSVYDAAFRGRGTLSENLLDVACHDLSNPLIEQAGSGRQWEG
jgi:hypothetical protein